MRLNDPRFRGGSADDVLLLAEVAVAGWETYRSFAPAAWTPATLAEEHGRVLATLRQPTADPDFGCDSGPPGVWCEPCKRVNIAIS